jgi:RNA polymerase sigma-70 factor (ECF subfamily)
MIDHETYIISQLREGKDSGYRYLYEYYYVRLCRVAKMYVGDTFAAENIVGDLIFYLWEHRETLEIHTSLNSYLFTAVRNRCLNYLQQASMTHETRLSVSAVEFLDIQHSDSSPLGEIIERELENHIDKSIAKLPDECRTVFQLSRQNELSYEEISSLLGISVNTVRYHIKNALANLRSNLKEYMALFF